MSERRRYPSDLSDARWALVEPLLTSWRDDQARHGLNIGTPPQHSLRDLLDAALYVARTGIPWRCLPHDYPHWNTVYHYFGRWEKAGIFAPRRWPGRHRRCMTGAVCWPGGDGHSSGPKRVQRRPPSPGWETRCRCRLHRAGHGGRRRGRGRELELLGLLAGRYSVTAVRRHVPAGPAAHGLGPRHPAARVDVRTPSRPGIRLPLRSHDVGPADGPPLAPAGVRPAGSGPRGAYRATAGRGRRLRKIPA
ncbi:transposase [Streptomyces sp. NBC_01547]